jgi:hypothetical protein
MFTEVKSLALLFNAPASKKSLLKLKPRKTDGWLHKRLVTTNFINCFSWEPIVANTHNSP